MKKTITVSSQIIENQRKFWANVAKKNNWYAEPFYIQVWLNRDGTISDSVSFTGITEDIFCDTNDKQIPIASIVFTNETKETFFTKDNKDYLHLPSVGSWVEVDNENSDNTSIIYPALKDGSVDFDNPTEINEVDRHWFANLSNEDCQLIWNKFKIEVNNTGVCDNTMEDASIIQKNFRVKAAMTTYLYIDVKANSEQEAKEFAEKVDGGNFISEGGGGDGSWEITEAFEIDAAEVSNLQTEQDL